MPNAFIPTKNPAPEGSGDRVIMKISTGVCWECFHFKPKILCWKVAAIN
jgi:hypothetical protein